MRLLTSSNRGTLSMAPSFSTHMAAACEAMVRMVESFVEVRGELEGGGREERRVAK